MAPRTPDCTTKPPSARADGAAYFYPTEVVRILGLRGIDYAQLRRLLRLVRPAGSQPSRGWARYSFEDLVAVRVAVGLAGGREALAQGRRLQIAEVERACARLHELGIARPLLEVPLRREGRAVLAECQGMTFRPATGQLALTEVSDRIHEFLAQVVPLEPRVVEEVEADVARERARLQEASRTSRTVRERGSGAERPGA
ncbi:MAG: hypothetical protein ACRDJU_13280 [Actinomycetota bacterium]